MLLTGTVTTTRLAGGDADNDSAATTPPDSVHSSAPAPAAMAPLGLAAMLTGAALPMVDFFIVNVALPTIDSDLGASTAALELVIAGYGIAYALFLVVGARLGDHVGRRRVFSAGLAAFTLASLLCGVAPNAGLLVAFRVVQGVSAAFMLPQTLSTIQAATDGAPKARAISLFSAVGGLAAIVGQVIGGVLVAANVWGLSWRPIFLVNVPIGLIALVLTARAVPETRSPNPPHVDRLGTAIFGVALLALLIPLTEGRSLGWPWWTWALLVLSLLSAVAFMRVERRAEQRGLTPLLPPSLMHMPTMRKGLTITVPWFAVFGGFMFAYVVTLQSGIGVGALQSGLGLAPMAIGAFISSLLSPRAVRRVGSLVVSYGAGLQGLGILTTLTTVATFWPHVKVLELAPGLFVTGLGQGLVMSTLYRVVLSKVPPDKAGVGSGALTTSQQAAVAIGVAVFGTLFTALRPAATLGLEGAFLIVLGLQAAVAAIIVVIARSLPDLRIS
jgi:EmrB/QacA subfamily drug resistance transporter